MQAGCKRESHPLWKMLICYYASVVLLALLTSAVNNIIYYIIYYIYLYITFVFSKKKKLSLHQSWSFFPLMEYLWYTLSLSHSVTLFTFSHPLAISWLTAVPASHHLPRLLLCLKLGCADVWHICAGIKHTICLQISFFTYCRSDVTLSNLYKYRLYPITSCSPKHVNDGNHLNEYGVIYDGWVKNIGHWLRR